MVSICLQQTGHFLYLSLLTARPSETSPQSSTFLGGDHLTASPFVALSLTVYLHSNARFRGSNSKSPGPGKTGSGSSQPPLSPLDLSRTQNSGSQSQSPASASLSANLPPLPKSPSFASTIGMADQGGMMTGGQDLESYQLPRPLPLWLNPNYAKHIVKGNFMTLSARPKTVEQGEWIAHQGLSS